MIGAAIKNNKVKIIQNIDSKFSKTIELDCDDSLKSFNGLYGYTTYDSVQYFEKITRAISTYFIYNVVAYKYLEIEMYLGNGSICVGLRRGWRC